MKTKIIWSVIVVLVLVGGYGAYAKYSGLWPFWKIYTNTQYGFEIQIPQSFGLLVRNGSEGAPGFFGGELGEQEVALGFTDKNAEVQSVADLKIVYLSVVPTSLTLQQVFAQDRNVNPTLSIKKITIQNGIEAVGKYLNGGDRCPIEVYTVHDGYDYLFNGLYPCGPALDQDPVLVKIANSFRFTK